MIDFVSKNGSPLFLKALSTKPFENAFLNALKLCRGKINKVKLKLLSRQVRLRREQTEAQLLMLIQMWADTFMMKEDQFPGFMSMYRQLRKEKVGFPPRDSNMRMLMENVCSDSPMFDFVEQAAGKEVRAPVSMVSAQAASSQSDAQSKDEGGPSKAELLAQFASQFDGDFGEIEFDDLNENVPI